MAKHPDPKRLARIVVAKLGIIGCSVGAWMAYHGGEDYTGHYIAFVMLAMLAFIVLVNDVNAGDNNDDDDKPNLRLRH